VAIEDFFTTPVTIVTPGSTSDRYNEGGVPDWVNPADQTAVSGWLEQQSAIEVLGGRDAQVVGWLLFLPAGAPINAGDRVIVDPADYELDASTFEVDGVPNVVSTPSGPHHTEVHLKLVEG
jgi:hypothetical protein